MLSLFCLCDSQSMGDGALGLEKTGVGHLAVGGGSTSGQGAARTQGQPMAALYVQAAISSTSVSLVGTIVGVLVSKLI